MEYRYGRDEMKTVFSEENRLHLLLTVEATLAEAHASVGNIPATVPDRIWRVIRAGEVRPERVREIEGEIRHDLMAVVRALSERCGDAGRYIHLGATSYDIIDTANAMQMKEAIGIILEGLRTLETTLADRAERHRDLVMIGRTHGQFAVPVTLGMKFAVMAMEIHRHRERLGQAMPRICAGKMSGATGSMAAFGEHAFAIQTYVMEELGITVEEAATQIVQRDRYAEYVMLLCGIAATLEKFATEIRNLQRSEIMEVAESFDPEKQVGSSTMAHKQNPITCENISGLARVIRGFLTPALENMIQWHERDLANSSSERFILPHVSILTDDIIVKTAEVFRNLRVFPDNIRRNLERSGGLPMAESVMMALTARGMGRQEAHEVVRQCSMALLAARDGVSTDPASDGKTPHLREYLLADPRVTGLLSGAEIDLALSHTGYTGKCGEIVDRVVATIRG